jgi:hypothetical protein
MILETPFVVSDTIQQIGQAHSARHVVVSYDLGLATSYATHYQ